MDQPITLDLTPTGPDQKLEVLLVNPVGGYLTLIASKNMRKVMDMHDQAKRLLEGK